MSRPPADLLAPPCFSSQCARFSLPGSKAHSCSAVRPVEGRVFLRKRIEAVDVCCRSFRPPVAALPHFYIKSGSFSHENGWGGVGEGGVGTASH